MQRVVIIGAGGHGQVVADILLAAREAGISVQPIGFVDDDRQRHGAQVLGLPVLGSIAAITAIEHDAVVIGIGDNHVRQRIFVQLRAQGARFVVARHPSAIVARNVAIGDGTVLAAGSIVNTGSTIGPNTIINTGCTVDHHNRIGAHVHLAPGAHLGGDVQIGDGTLIGIGAIVMPQRRVGAATIVGAGAVVQRDLPDHVVAIGVPARIVQQQEE